MARGLIGYLRPMGVARRAGAASPDLRTLARLGRLVTASLGTDAVLEAVGGEAADLVGATHVGFWIAGEASRTLTLHEVGPQPTRTSYPLRALAHPHSVLGSG